MARLVDNASGKLIGTITLADIDFLRAELEEESSDDQDYWIEEATIDLLEQAGGPAPLIALLRDAVRGREGIEVRWEDEPA